MPKLKANSWAAWTLQCQGDLPEAGALLIRRYLAFRRTRVVPSVAAREERWLVRWCVFLHERDCSLGKASADDAVDMAALWDDWDWSPSCRRQFATCLRGFHEWLIDRGDGIRNPWRQIRAPRERENVVRVLSADQIAALIGALDRKTWRDGRDRAMIALLFALGCRVSELTGIDLGDFDLEADTAIVYGAKTRRERILPFDEVAAQALRVYLEAVRPHLLNRQSGGALFLGRHGRRIHRGVVADALDRAADRAGLPRHIWPHLLRHSFATDLLENGADLRHVQELLGHENIASTVRYTHIARRALAAVYRKTHTEPRTQPAAVGRLRAAPYR